MTTDSSTDSNPPSAISSSARGLARRSSGYLGVLRRFAVVIIALTVVGAVAATVFAVRRPTTYTATAAILVTSAGVDAAAGRTASPEEDNRSVANAVALAETRSVATEALVEVEGSASNDSIDLLQTHLSIGQRPDTSVLEVSVTDEDPERAAALANAVGEAYQSARAEIPSMGAAYVIDDAEVPTSANGLSRPVLILAGVFLGLVLGVTTAFVLEQFRVDDPAGSAPPSANQRGETTEQETNAPWDDSLFAELDSEDDASRRSLPDRPGDATEAEVRTPSQGRPRATRRAEQETKSRRRPRSS